ncbi:MAG TPA: ABC transporter ATP-binding protein [Parachlamydiaceae bacterium]|nr:ABC transporter ATP-binding protein [Parachlamydiaceae bacterium]
MNKLPTTLWAFLWHFIKKQWLLFALIQLFCFGWSLDHTLWPYIFMRVIDAITNMPADRSMMWQVLTPTLWMWVILWIGLEFSFRMSGILMAKAIPKMEADVRMSMFDYVQHHSYRYFNDNLAGALANKISDMVKGITNVFQLLSGLFFPVLLAVLIAFFSFLLIQPFFALILFVWVLAHLSICLYFSNGCSDYANIHAEAKSRLSGSIVDSFTNHVTFRLFGRQGLEYRHLLSLQNKEIVKQEKTLFYIEKMKLALGIASFLGPGVAITWFMLYAWQQEIITTGEVVFIFNITWNITMMVWIAGLEFPKLFKEIGVCRQALTILQDKHDIVDATNAVPLALTHGEIIFDHVSFRYNKKTKIFDGHTVVIQAGEKVGLVGFSGSGKTTFVNLILRHYDLEQGKILIDGQDISKVTQKSLRRQIALIPQDPSLFHRTVMENLRYGLPSATDEEVYEASKKAHCHEFILRLEKGYDTVVGERGAKLSGGQRQRIAIARAILKNAPILILDEATSALDSVTEKYIQESLTGLMQGRTALVVAHRLSTLSGMDRILVFQDGKIIEEGSHEDLLEEDGYYAELWRMQAGGFLPDS